ncbi:unnamed protein product [Urochloa humidicola]
MPSPPPLPAPVTPAVHGPTCPPFSLLASPVPTPYTLSPVSSSPLHSPLSSRDVKSDGAEDGGWRGLAGLAAVGPRRTGDASFARGTVAAAPSRQGGAAAEVQPRHGLCEPTASRPRWELVLGAGAGAELL